MCSRMRRTTSPSVSSAMSLRGPPQRGQVSAAKSEDALQQLGPGQSVDGGVGRSARRGERRAGHDEVTPRSSRREDSVVCKFPRGRPMSDLNGSPTTPAGRPRRRGEVPFGSRIAGVWQACMQQRIVRGACARADSRCSQRELRSALALAWELARRVPALCIGGSRAARIETSSSVRDRFPRRLSTSANRLGSAHRARATS